MINRDDRRRGVERPQFGAYEGTGDEHGEPREFRYGSDFDKQEAGRWVRQDRENVFSRPYDEWSNPSYAFYAGKGYHREFIDPYATSVEDEGGRGWQLAPESRRGPFSGFGPRGYVRSDERIAEDVNEQLEEHGEIDATEVLVTVSDREVTLEGVVEDRKTKRLVEDVAASARGVRDVHNRLRVSPRGTEVVVDVHGDSSHSGSGFLTENRETRRTRPR